MGTVLAIVIAVGLVVIISGVVVSNTKRKDSRHRRPRDGRGTRGPGGRPR